MSSKSSAFTNPGNSSRAWIEYESCSPVYDTHCNRQPAIRCERHLGPEEPGQCNAEELKKGTKKSGKRVQHPRRKGWKVAGKDEDERCTICLDAFVPNEQVVITPCNHMFHGECLALWAKESGKCPICRRAISEKMEAVN